MLIKVWSRAGGAAAATAAILALCLSSSLAGAQVEQAPRPPEVPAPTDPRRAIPEKVAPPDNAIPSSPAPSTGGSGSGDTPSDHLGRSDGVIRPPTDMDRDIYVPAPVPDPGTTKVIPPPGSPGNPSNIRPK